MELDVQLTLDDEVIVAHDGDLIRMCGSDKLIQTVNYADLPPMKRSIDMHLSDGAYDLRDEEDGKFTLLRDLFEAQKDDKTFYSIDLKNASDTICIKTNELVKKYDMEQRVIWGSMFKE